MPGQTPGGTLAAVLSTLETRAQQARRSCGVLAAVKECRVVTALKLVVVFSCLGCLHASFADRESMDLTTLSRKQRPCCLRRCFPLVWHDCARTLMRFIRGNARASAKSALSKLRLGFAWASSILAAMLPDSPAEDACACVRRVAVAARRMTPVRGANLHLEARGRTRPSSSKSCHARQRYAAAAEGLPFRKRARERRAGA